MEHIETVIIGGGQAGLATSYGLTQAGHTHVVLEQAAQAAHPWRNERWDSFTMVTPNWATRMPGAEYAGDDPDGFMTRVEIVAFFERYIERFRLPLHYNTHVRAITPLNERGYLVDAEDRTYTARNVVVATGLLQQPRVPAPATNLAPDIVQMHSGMYRDPGSIPAGAVLVVGSAQSGCQIAEELYQHGRTVFLATGAVGRLPRRYRGKDVITWLEELGFFNLTPEQLPPGMGKFDAIPQLSGKNGGHTINLHQFARDGVRLLGHVRDIEGHNVMLAPDLHDNLAGGDAFEQEVTREIDGFVEQHGLDAPEEGLPQLDDGFQQPVVEALELKAAGIGTVIWGTGYGFDYSMVKVPVRDADGFPIQSGGVTRYPGLYFVGMPWMPTERSGFLIGVGESALAIASHIVEFSARPRDVLSTAS